jgi:phosphonate transport system permease protein
MTGTMARGGRSATSSAPAGSSLGALLVAEGVGVGGRVAGPARPWGRRHGLGWVVALVLLAVWAVWATGVGRRDLLNPGGWPLVAKFVRAAASPDLSSAFLRQTGGAALTTVAYAVLGTALSVLLGLSGGVLLARTTWRRRLSGPAGRGWLRGNRFSLGRAALAVPRGIHEAVWGLLLATVLGRNPLVGVLAIALPYGAITAKVYADLIDETAAAEHRALRAAGATRLGALCYGVLPAASGDLVSYAFYRFECSIRAAVVLGMIGAGGLGFQLSQSFQGLAYNQLWTSLYALVGLGLAAEAWSWAVRRRTRPVVGRVTLTGALALVGVSWWQLGLAPSTLWSERTRDLAGRLVTDAWPPRWPPGGWSVVVEAAIATLHLSLLAILIALLAAVPLALLGSRGLVGSSPPARLVSVAGRAVALLFRSIPPPVWALLVLFVVLPGLVPGTLALGLYTFGVLARLMGEVVENADPQPRRALTAAGAARTAAFAYADLPQVGPRWAVFALYRWEVAAREVAVVGVVGAGGLGRLLAEQTVRFDYRAMLVTVVALIGVTVIVDVISTGVRRAMEQGGPR